MSWVHFCSQKILNILTKVVMRADKKNELMVKKKSFDQFQRKTNDTTTTKTQLKFHKKAFVSRRCQTLNQRRRANIWGAQKLSLIKRAEVKKNCNATVSLMAITSASTCLPSFAARLFARLHLLRFYQAESPDETLLQEWKLTLRNSLLYSVNISLYRSGENM